MIPSPAAVVEALKAFRDTLAARGYARALHFIPEPDLLDAMRAALARAVEVDGLVRGGDLFDLAAELVSGSTAEREAVALAVPIYGFYLIRAAIAPESFSASSVASAVALATEALKHARAIIAPEISSPSTTAEVPREH